jgi:predicted tellurium resistance membrane protein TerC
MEFIFAVLTLTFLEIILGIDNIMFVSIVTNKLDKKEQQKARILGLLGAMIARIILLVLMVWLIQHLTKPFFPIPNTTVEQTIEKYKASTAIIPKLKLLFHTIGIREIILLSGGLFLLSKSVTEIHQRMEGGSKEIKTKHNTLGGTIIEIIAVDIIFSFDSILTAIGITKNLPAMIIAVILAISVMMLFSAKISQFMSIHPSLEIMGLSFLVLIGVMLILSSVHYEIPRGYIYFSVFFALGVEIINMNIKQKVGQTVELNKKVAEPKQ